MNIENLNRRFIFINNYDTFKNEALPYLSEHNRDAIVFIASNKTIWTNGVEFNSSAVKNYVDTIYEQWQLSKDAFDNELEEQLLQIKDNLTEAKQQLDLDIEDAKDRLAAAEQKAKELEEAGYTKESHDELNGLVKDLSGKLTGLITWKEDLEAEDGLFKKLVTYEDFANNNSTVYKTILDVFKTSWTQALERYDIDGTISTKIAELWLAYKNGDALWKTSIESSIEQLNGQFKSDNIWLLLKSGLTDEIEAAVTRGLKGPDGRIDAILAALSLEITEDGFPSWHLVASKDDNGDNFIQASIRGWLDSDNTSKINIKADHITFDGLTFHNYLSTWYSGISKPTTTVSNEGIQVLKGEDDGDRDIIELYLRDSEDEFSGLRHYYIENTEEKEGSFALNVDGSGYLGRKNDNGKSAIQWNTDGDVEINYNFLTDESGTKVDFSKLGGYRMLIFTAGRREETSEGIMPEIPGTNDVFGAKTTFLETTDNVHRSWRWYKSSAIPGYNPNDNDLWMASRILKNDGSTITGYDWEGPWCISGTVGADGSDGTPGSDGNAINYLFVHSKTNTRWADVDQSLYNNDNLSYIPDSPTNNVKSGDPAEIYKVDTSGIGVWLDSAFSENAALNTDYPYVWMCFSTTKVEEEIETKDGKVTVSYYKNYSDPIIWSRWGKDGRDGDGVEYIFYRSDSQNINWDNLDPSLNLNPSKWQTSQQNGYIPDGSEWEQNPPMLTAQGLVIWVSIRKRDSEGNWGRYTPPVIWAYYSKDGQALYAYTMDFTNENLVVSVNSEGHLATTYDNTVEMQVWNPSGTRIPSLSEIIDKDGKILNYSGEFFKLEIGDSSVSAVREEGDTDWKSFVVTKLSTTGYELNPFGKYVTVNIIGEDDFNSRPNYYAPLESIRDKHIYCNVKVIIGNTTDYDDSDYSFTTVYERTVVLSIFGVYTGQDGLSIELKTSSDVISLSNGVLSPSEIKVYALLVSGGLNKSIIVSQPKDNGVANDQGFKFLYRIGTDVGTDWSYVPVKEGEGCISLSSNNIDTSKSLYIRLLYCPDTSNPSKDVVIDNETVCVVKDGNQGPAGVDGVSSVRSYIFTRCNGGTPLSPSHASISGLADESGVNDLGTFNNPVPHGKYSKVYGLGQDELPLYLDAVWSDGVPFGTYHLWESFATFYSDGTSTNWSDPNPVQDTVDLDIEFSNEELYTPIEDDWTTEEVRNQNGWYDPNDIGGADQPKWSDIIWRAERKRKNGVYDGAWSYMRVRGEKGEHGESGIFLYLDNQCDIIATDATGVVTRDTTISTKVTLFDGTEKLTLGESHTLEDDTVENRTVTVSSNLYPNTLADRPNISYDNGSAKIDIRVPKGTQLSAGTKYDAIISTTYKKTEYRAIFSITAANIGINKYTLKYDRNTLLFSKQEEDDKISYTGIYDTVEISFNKETNNGVTEVNRTPDGYTLSCGFTGDTDNTPIEIDTSKYSSYASSETDLVPIFITADYNSKYIIKITPIVKDGDIVYKEFWVELTNGDYTDRLSFLIQSTGLDGKGKRFIVDLDNDSDSVMCDKLGEYYKVRHDTVIETNIRCYDQGKLVRLILPQTGLTLNNLINYELFNVDNGKFVFDSINGDSFNTDDSNEDDPKAYFKITIPEGTLLTSEINYVTFAVTNRTGTYYGKLKIRVVDKAAYNLIPSKTSIVFFYDEEGNYEGIEDYITCSYTITDEIETKTYSYTSYTGKETLSIYVRYEHGGFPGKWLLYNETNENGMSISPNMDERDENSISYLEITGITFALAENAKISINEDNEIQTEIEDIAESIETVPVLYNVKGDKGDNGSDGKTPDKYVVLVVNNTIESTPNGTSGKISVNVKWSTFNNNSWTDSIATSLNSHLVKYKVGESEKNMSMDDDRINWLVNISSPNAIRYITINVYKLTVVEGQRVETLVYSETIPLNNISRNYMYYPAGSWDSSKSYSISNGLVPYVYYNNEYYYLLLSYTPTSGDDNTKYIPGENNTHWEKINQMLVILTDGIISDYGKLSEAVFYNGFMFSQLGKYNGYVKKYDDPISSGSEEKVCSRLALVDRLYTNYDVSVETGSIKQISDVIWIPIGANVQYYRGIKTLLQQNVSILLRTWDYDTGYIGNGHGGNFICDTPSYYTVAIENKSGNTVLYAAQATIDISDVFIPNWIVDLRTGAMSSGCGNFVSRPSGDLELGKGSFIVDGETGDLTIGGGTFTVDGDTGDLSIGGGTFEVDGETGAVTAANGNLVVSPDGSVSIGKGNITVNALTGDITTIKTQTIIAAEYKRLLRYGSLSPNKIWHVLPTDDDNSGYYTGSFSYNELLGTYTLDEPESAHEYYGNANTDIFYISPTEENPYVYIPEPNENSDGKVIEVYNYGGYFEIRTVTTNTGWWLRAPNRQASNPSSSDGINFYDNDGVHTVYTKLCCTGVTESGSNATRYYWVVIEDRLSDGTLRTL